MSRGKPRLLTDAQEDELFDKWNLRKMLSSKALCAQYHISRRTMLDVVRRAKSRRISAEIATDSNGR